MLRLFKTPVYVIIGIILVAITVSGVFYVKHNENVKEKLLAENASLLADVLTYKDALNLQTKTIDYLQEQQIKRAEEFLKIESTFAIINDEKQNLNDKLENSLKTSSGNVEATEVIVNQISNNINRCFELLSGAPLNEAERKAKNANEFNSECPWFYSSRSSN
jgi:hypothetical protein